MITSIIFSKDRALQLDLTLRTINKNLELCDDVVVIYKTSEQRYKESYENLKAEHPNVLFCEQSHSLFVDILAVISGVMSDYVCFFTDDNIVYRKVDITKDDVNNLFNLVGAHGERIGCSCLSLRLGVNIKKRDFGSGFVDELIPPLYSMPPFFVWGFTGLPPGGYWSYPLSVDGHILQKETILRFCIELEALSKYYEQRNSDPWRQTPNEFEAKLQRFFFDLPSSMATLENSCVVNSPNNRVQNHIPNRCGNNFGYTAVELDNYYKSGKRLNVDKINFDNIVCPHQEIDILKGLK